MTSALAAQATAAHRHRPDLALTDHQVCNPPARVRLGRQNRRPSTALANVGTTQPTAYGSVLRTVFLSYAQSWLGAASGRRIAGGRDPSCVLRSLAKSFHRKCCCKRNTGCLIPTYDINFPASLSQSNVRRAAYAGEWGSMPGRIVPTEPGKSHFLPWAGRQKKRTALDFRPLQNHLPQKELESSICCARADKGITKEGGRLLNCSYSGPASGARVLLSITATRMLRRHDRIAPKTNLKATTKPG